MTKPLVDYEKYSKEELDKIVTCPGCNGTGERSTFTMYKLPCPFCLRKGVVTFYGALRAEFIMKVSGRINNVKPLIRQGIIKEEMV